MAKKINLFNRGDVLRTNPKEGFWGIAVVLSQTEKTPEAYPQCHIATTPLVFKHEVGFDEINESDLKPMEFNRLYSLEKQEEFYKPETIIGVYSRNNKANIEVIGTVDPLKIYDGPLPFSPDYRLKVTWPLNGFADSYLGMEAVINFERGI